MYPLQQGKTPHKRWEGLVMILKSILYKDVRPSTKGEGLDMTLKSILYEEVTPHAKDGGPGYDTKKYSLLRNKTLQKRWGFWV